MAGQTEKPSAIFTTSTTAPEWISQADLARALGKSNRTLRGWELPQPRRLGRRSCYRVAELLWYLDRGQLQKLAKFQRYDDPARFAVVREDARTHAELVWERLQHNRARAARVAEVETGRGLGLLGVVCLARTAGEAGNFLAAIAASKLFVEK